MTEHDLRHAEAERIFLELCDLSPEARKTRLRKLGEGAPRLHAEVTSLLDHHDQVSVETIDGVPPKAIAPAWARAGDDPSLAGQQIGVYRIIREIGRGGMGVVLLGERIDQGVQKYVAIKVMKRGLDTEQLLQRFRQERRILSAITHPGVAGFLDAGETDDGRLYVVMQYVEGLPLTEYCDVHRLDIEERLRLFQKVCDAVECVNRHMIVHRDLKPSNILVTEDVQPKILDFGIAKFLNPDLASGGGPPTSPDSRMMTPEYASPEQVRGNPLTTASDVYSLGVLLYEILCGHPPYRFGHNRHHDVMEKVCERDPDVPSTAVVGTETAQQSTGLRKSITPDTVSRARRSDPGRLRRRLQGDLDHIVMMALRKEPQRRYQSARELAEDLNRHLDRRPVLAGADTLAYRFRKFVRRNRVAVAAVAFIALSLVIGITGTGYGYVEATGARDRANDHIQRLVDVALGYVDDLDDALEVLDGSLPLRQEFVETAVGLLEEATSTLEGREDRDARLTLARAYRRLGEIEGSRRNPNRGDVDRAMVWYEQSREQIEAWLDEAPGDPEARRELAFTLIAQGDVLDGRKKYDEARQLDEQAHAIMQELYDADPRDRESRSDLAASLVVLGRDARRNGDRDRAEVLFREALQLRRDLAEEQEGDEAAQRALSVALFALGNVRAEDGDSNEARRRYEEAIGIRRKLAESAPGNARYRRDLITAAYMTAVLLKGMGDFDAALSHVEPTIAILEETVLRNPQESRSKQDLAAAQVLIGLVRIEQERWDDAKRALDAGYALASQLLDLDPERGTYKSLVAGSRLGLAKVSLARGDASAAKATILAAIPLTGRTPEVLAELARAQRALGEIEEAQATANEALEALGDRADADAETLRSKLHEMIRSGEQHED